MRFKNKIISFSTLVVSRTPYFFSKYPLFGFYNWNNIIGTFGFYNLNPCISRIFRTIAVHIIKMT